MQHVKKYRLVGVANGWGAPVRGTEDGPDALKSSSLLALLQARGLSASWGEVIYPELRAAENKHVTVRKVPLPMIADVCHRTARLTESLVQEEYFPVVIGGDHVMAAGTWSGITAGQQAQKEFGLIWFDAHMDSHTLETTPSHAYHGMPLAGLLGHGVPALAHVLNEQPKIAPQHLVLMGIRSYESGEQELLERLGVRIFYMEEIRERGFEACLEEALKIVTRGTKGFGMSLDLDGFDPLVAPGVGVPAAGGLLPEEVLLAFPKIARHPAFSALEVVELNPELDQGGKTLKLAQEVISLLLT